MPIACSPDISDQGTGLAGLVLAGGRSLRMGRDKAYLLRGGQTQLTRAHALLTPLVSRCHVSVRRSQFDDPLRAGFPCIVDRHDDIGPAAGILAAHAFDATTAWLVVACDLPLLDAQTLLHLCLARVPGSDAVAYRDAVSGTVEPLCAIWEPAACRALAQSLAAGDASLCRVLERVRTRWLCLETPEALANANTPDDLARLLAPSTHAV